MTTAIQLAALTERLSNHIDATERAIAEDRRERVLAAEERHAIIAKLEALHRDMQAVKPVTDMVTSLRAKITGGVIVLGFIGTVAWGGVILFKDQLLRWMGG